MHEVLNLAEARAYLSGDRITCLICERSFLALGGHLFIAHGISAKAYKRRFGLAYTKGLVSTITHKLMGERRQNATPPVQTAEGLRKSIKASTRSLGSYRRLARGGSPFPFTPQELVQFKPGVTAADLARRLSRPNSSISRKYRQLGIIPKRAAVGRPLKEIAYG